MYSTGKFAKMIGVCPGTLINWDKKGILSAKRTPTGKRFYTDEQYVAYMKGAMSSNEGKQKTKFSTQKGHFTNHS